MKKVLIAGGLLIAMSSCGSKMSAEDVKVEDIKDACGCVDAMEIISADILDFVDSKGGNPDDFSEEDEKTAEKKFSKVEEVMGHCMGELGVSKSDLEGCPNFETVDNNMNKIKDL